MKRALTEAQVRKELAKAVEAAGGQAAWGRIHGLSRSYICKVLGGHKVPGESIVAALGLRSVTAYQRDAE